MGALTAGQESFCLSRNNLTLTETRRGSTWICILPERIFQEGSPDRARVVRGVGQGDHSCVRVDGVAFRIIFVRSRRIP